MGTTKFARESPVWRNLINAIALEVGLAPVLSALPGEELATRVLLGMLPIEERRALTRKFRKLRRKMAKHASRPIMQRTFRQRRSGTTAAVLVDIIEDCCIDLFPQLAAMFDDLTMRGRQKYTRHARMFKSEQLEILKAEFKQAAAKLAGGVKR
jgi:hypothetical protein